MLNAITLSQIFVLDQDQALDFYVGKLGLQVHTDRHIGPMRWLTVHAPGDPGRQLLLEQPGPPMMDPATAEEVRELITKGVGGGWFSLATDDARKAYETMQERGVEITDEPVERDYGTDFGIRDPFGNRVRIVQHAPGTLTEADR